MQNNMYARREFSAETLLSSLPEIRRMRGWRLYAADGRRILSLWSDYGRNLLGYTPRGLAERAKSALDRGLIAPAPGSWNDRIVRMTRNLYSEYSFIRLRSSPSRPQRIESARFLFQEYLQENQSAGISISGEYAEQNELKERPEPVQIIVPIPHALSPGIFAYTSKPSDTDEHELIDGMRGACAIFGLSLMASELDSSALTARFKKSWERFDRCNIELFSRRGPWLLPRYGAEAHRELFTFCIARGVLISPDYSVPSSVPGDFDEGELRCLQEAAAVFL